MAQAMMSLHQEPKSFQANVVPLHFTILPRHREYLNRWLQAGLCMGLCDAEIETDVSAVRGETVAHVLVWVRENADPAYIVEPRGMRWVLIDHIRDHELGIYASFEQALHTIRPVLPLNSSAAA